MTSPTEISPEYLRLWRLVRQVVDPSTRSALSALIPIVQDKEPVTMADITQALSDLDSAVKGVADRSTSDVAALQAQIEELKAAGVNTAQLEAIADSIEGNVAKLNAIDPVADVPADPGTPTEEPAPADPGTPDV